MRAVIQRASQASVTIDGRVHGAIDHGLLVFVGIEKNDEPDDARWLARKTATLRIFNDKEGKMNWSVADVAGNLLVISQFTLHAKTKKGTRPSYIRAAKPETAIPLYEAFLEYLKQETGRRVETGKFGADMKVGLINNGPVTIWIDTRNKE